MPATNQPGTSSSKAKTALLLGGGGARAAYQVGVLKAIAEILPEHCDNPFPIISGTSAGSINAAALASNAADFRTGVKKILAVWSNFKLNQVFRIEGMHLLKRVLLWLWSNIGWGDHTRGPDSLLDNQPLRELLNENIHFERIEKNLQTQQLHGWCVNACSYTTGDSTAFFHGHESIKEWQRTHREGRHATITVEHLMASAAIPVIFPSIRLGNEYFGDGSMRQIAPISPALHLGADKVLIIGLRIEESGKADNSQIKKPTLAQISGYVLDTLFLNSLCADVERLSRINDTIEQLPDEQTSKLKKVDHLIITPSIDIADVAMKHFHELPKSFRLALHFLGLRKNNSRRFISYLMFIESFCQELIEAGYQDAMNQREQLQTFLNDPAQA